MKENKHTWNLISILLIGLLVGTIGTTWFLGGNGHNHDMKGHSMDDMMSEFMFQKDSVIQNLMPNGNYRCCLEKPCSYCIGKTPNHGESASCDCLNDIVNGRAPCGECMGEILEGHGNPYLAEYFAVAIADEVGEQHLNTLKQIISEKYEITIEDQN